MACHSEEYLFLFLLYVLIFCPGKGICSLRTAVLDYTAMRVKLWAALITVVLNYTAIMVYIVVVLFELSGCIDIITTSVSQDIAVDCCMYTIVKRKFVLNCLDFLA